MFTAHGRGFYSLTKARPSGVEEAIQRHNQEVRERLHSELREMHPRAFEELIAQLLEALGFEDVEVTSYTGDGGIDVRGTLSVGGVTNVRTAIQVKRLTKSSVSAATVQQLRGGLSPHERGLIITVGKFTRDALAEASMQDRTPISLVDGERLVDLLVENQIGAEMSKVPLLRLNLASLLPSDEAETAVADESPEDQEESVTTAVASFRPPRRRSTRRPDGRVLSLWPLPGGRGNFVQALTAMLAFVSENEPTLDEFFDWMMTAFPTVKSRKTAMGYLDVPRSAGLVEPKVDRLTVTADGAAYLVSQDPEELFRIMAARIAGLEETLARLRRGPCTLPELTTFLNDLLGTEWQTDAQPRWRVMWLESFGKAKRDGDTWVAFGGFSSTDGGAPAASSALRAVEGVQPR
jgi:hypothetical protein